MSLFFWQYLAVPLAGFIVLSIGTFVLLMRAPDAEPRTYYKLAAVVGLCTFLVGGQVETAIDRRWAINRADSVERAIARQTEWLPRLLTMGVGAHAALNVGRTEQAAQWAQQLVSMAEGHEHDQNYGGAIHDGNIVLGRIALQRGDVETAKRHLLAAGNTPGSPTLNSFGPDMLLARDLLARDEQDTVLAYLDECQRFWNQPRHLEQLREWRSAIANGEMPDFEGNFHY